MAKKKTLDMLPSCSPQYVKNIVACNGEHSRQPSTPNSFFCVESANFKNFLFGQFRKVLALAASDKSINLAWPCFNKPPSYGVFHVFLKIAYFKMIRVAASFVIALMKYAQFGGIDTMTQKVGHSMRHYISPNTVLMKVKQAISERIQILPFPAFIGIADINATPKTFNILFR